MKLEEIQELWDVDCVINPSDVGNDSLKSAKLHAKYFKIYSAERLLLRKMQEDLSVLKHLKYEYYSGSLDDEVLKERGWSPNQLRILKSDIPQYIAADEDIVKTNLKVALQQEKVDFLDSIIREIRNRGYLIKNYIDFKKFQEGY